MTPREPIIIELPPAPVVSEAEYTAAMLEYYQKHGINPTVLYSPCALGRIEDCRAHRRTEAQERHEAEQAAFRSTFWQRLVMLTASVLALLTVAAIGVPLAAVAVGGFVPLALGWLTVESAMRVEWRQV